MRIYVISSIQIIKEMKKILTFLFAIQIMSFAMAQGCLPEGITFHTQAQINSFALNYPGCNTIIGNVLISDDGSDNITNLDSLAVLNDVKGDLIISENYDLIDISGLHNLRYVGGDFSIMFNYQISGLQGLIGIDSIGGNLFIETCNVIPDLEGLNNLSRIGGNLSIIWNSNLTSLNGLGNLKYIGGGLTLETNILLTDISSLTGLTSLNGDLFIFGNNSLPSLTGLISITSIEGNFMIGFNESLTNLSGLDSLFYVSGEFEIDDNYSLISLAGLGAITNIGAGLVINNNNSLTSLTALDSLKSAGGLLGISGNSFLSSLAGLDHIHAGSITGLLISNNGSLSTCEVKSVCDYLASTNATVDISNNSAGCNSRQEVEEACHPLSTELMEDASFSIYPSPASTFITIETSSILDNNKLLILDLTGQEVYCQQIDRSRMLININQLPVGMYLVKVIGNTTVQIGNFIKE